MNGVQIAGGVVMLIISVLLCIVVVMQESPQQGGLSALGGGDSFFSQNKGRTRDEMLSKVTRILGIAFVVVTLLTYGIPIWFGG